MLYKVVCIEETIARDEIPLLKKGNIYHVIKEENFINAKDTKGRQFENGLYYYLIESGEGCCYHSSLFIEINDNQQDETEMIREVITEKQS